MIARPDVELSVPELRRRSVAALERRGASAEEAEVVFADYLDAEVRGRASHGFASFDVALAAFPKRGRAKIASHDPGVIAMQGNGDCGHTALRFALDVAVRHIAEQRAYVIGVSDITRVNCPGVIARYGVERGVITLVLEYGGMNLMGPAGVTEPVLSTNPLAIGIPGVSPLFLLDMATSERALGYVTLARMAGEKIPSSWGSDADGNSTEDPDRITVLRPFGGHKGFGLGLAIELLAGVLTGTPVGSRGSLASRGAFMLLLSPSVFGVQEADFSAAAQSFLDDVVAAGTNGSVAYPGQASARRWARVMDSQTLSMPAEVWEKLSMHLGGWK